MFRLVVLFLILGFPVSAQAAEVLVVELVRVVDGDTIIVNIDGWPPVVGHEIGIRVNGCDTPELRDKRPDIKAMAYRAKETVDAILRRAEVIELHNIGRGKYFRLVADVYADGVSLANILIASGLALPYDGGRRPEW